MLNIEATLGLWLLRSMNNWKKLIKGLIRRPLNPAESLLMSCWALPWALCPPAEGSLHSTHQPKRPPAAAQAQKGWELPGDEGWGWPRP